MEHQEETSRVQSISFGRHVMLAGEQELYSRWKREVKELAGGRELQSKSSGREREGRFKGRRLLWKTGLQGAGKFAGPGRRRQRWAF